MHDIIFRMLQVCENEISLRKWSHFTSIACTKTVVMHTICPRHFFRGKFSKRGEALSLVAGLVTR